MTRQHDKQRALCEKLRKLGYARARHVRLYGEDFHLISDPFPEGDGFVVEGIARRSGRSRVVRIPLSTVHTLQRELTFEAQSEIAA